ncbi:MAG: matrixin family metalloprotease [Calditrichota bacterium]
MRRAAPYIFSLILCVGVLAGGWYTIPLPSHLLFKTSLQTNELQESNSLGAVCFAPGTPEEYMAGWQERIFGPNSLDYRLGARWTSTATNGFTGSTGNPITLTYSFVPDGTIIQGQASQLYSRMNTLFGNQQTWQNLFARVFERWSEVCGIQYVQEVDDGAVFGNASGLLGVRGDVRIGSINVDGPSNVLAFNYYPNNGDMVLDASENWASTTNDYIFFRNIVAHEHGHGWGLNHVCPANSSKLLEPYYSPSFDGPQHDDIRAAIFNYGDRFEPNNSAFNATQLGNLSHDTTLSDIGITNLNDEDWWAFTVPNDKGVTITVEPIGYEYLEGPQLQDGNCDPGSLINSRDDLNLDIYLYDGTGTSLERQSTTHPAGEAERIYHFDPPAVGGDYALKVTRSGENNVQLYDLIFDIYNVSDPYLTDEWIDFDTTQVGTPITRQTILVNNAATSLTVYSVAVSGPFTVDMPDTFTVGAASSVALNITYLAQSIGRQTGTLTLTHNGTGSALHVNLAATAVDAWISFVTTSTGEFGEVGLGRIDSLRIPIRAMGNVPITIESVTINEPFSILLDLPMDLLPTQTFFLRPRFAPTSLGEFSDMLVIHSSGSSTPDTLFLHGTCVPVSADEIPASLPQAFRLAQNYPNPFNPATQIAFDLPRAAEITLSVYDIQGRLVRELVRGNLTAGKHTVDFDGSNLPSGVYLYRLSAPDFEGMGKMMLLK